MSSPHHLNTEELQQVKEKAIKLLPELRKKLGDKGKGVSDENLLKFLHWKPDIKRASERFLSHVQWRKKNMFVFDDDPSLLASKDPTLKRLLEGEVLVAPDGCIDKEGNAVLFGRFRNNDMSDGRSPQDVINGVTVFHDLRDLSRNHIHPAIPKMLLSAVIGNFPIRIKGVYMLDAPGFIRVLFKALSLLMPSKLRQRIHFVKSLSDIPINKENLLPDHNGMLKFDVKQWVEARMQHETDSTVSSLSSIPIKI